MGAGLDPANETIMIEYISNNTLVGILPLPHAIVMRKYEPNAKTNIWFTTLLFGAIFTHSNRKLPIFEDMKEVRLFNIIPI